uniref:Uncharacterized protein n=1 Tax=Leersia perrieri TaxID=77586 RepID=A0A0D9V8W3_9ORYZ
MAACVMDDGDGMVLVDNPPIQCRGGAQPAVADCPPLPSRRRGGRPHRRPSTGISCKIFATAFVVVMGLALITEFFFIMFLDSFPSPINVVLFLPVTLLVIAAFCACSLSMIVRFDDRQTDGNRRVQNSPV